MGKHNGPPDTATQDGHREKPPNIPLPPKKGGGGSGNGSAPEKKK